ncbi:MAG: hypothetical protein AUG49_14100 [Catenulispora sp. 13_1_20CM_3_70_7]|nr:MAG: hypothetical protein AUG49_14100 [Catenulispora sp. 13_1_20CM_3_70_7]
MTTIRFHFASVLTPSEVREVLTDFSPARPASWPSIDADHFVVHEIGDTWAVVTEGTASAWERARYEWDPDGDRVVIVTQDSKLFGPGGGWVFRLTPEGSGTRVEVELTRAPKAFKGKLLASLLPLVGPSALRKSFREPLKAVDRS